MSAPALFATLFLALLALPSLAPAADEDIAKHPSCKYCGMDREKWNFSRLRLEYDDGGTTGVCSLHCAAIDLALNIDKSPKQIWVADFVTRQLVNAEKAVWVMGGMKPGVMTGRAKWAFADQAAAEAFIDLNQGQIVPFDEALRSAYVDMYEDTRMIRERRAARREAAAEPRAPAPDLTPVR